LPGWNFREVIWNGTGHLLDLLETPDPLIGRAK